MKMLWTLLRVTIGASLLYYVMSRTQNWAVARQLLSAVWLFPLLAAQTLSGMAIESRRMGVLFRSQGLDVSLGYGYQVSAIASFFSVCIPGGTGGDVMKLYYLSSRNPGKGIEIATVLLLDRIVAMFSLLCLIVSLAVAEGSLMRNYAVIRVIILVAVSLLAALPCFGALCCSARVRANRWYGTILAKVPLRRHIARASDAVYAFHDHKGALAAAAGLSLAGHVLLAGVFAAAGAVVLPQASGLQVCVRRCSDVRQRAADYPRRNWHRRVRFPGVVCRGGICGRRPPDTDLARQHGFTMFDRVPVVYTGHTPTSGRECCPPMTEKSYAQIQAEVSDAKLAALPPFHFAVVRNVMVELVEPYLRYYAAQIGLRAITRYGGYNTLYHLDYAQT